MTIAVNTRLLVPDQLDGIGIFARETLRRIVLAHPEHRFVFLYHTPFGDEYRFADNVEQILVPPHSRDPLTWTLWFEVMIPRALERVGADLFLSPEPALSLRADVPTVSVFHDLNYEHRPQDMPARWRSYYRLFSKRWARRAERIATVSGYSKNDLIRTYGISDEKIDVVWNGASDVFHPLLPVEQEDVRRKYTGGSPYFYFVGTLHPRKNVVGMLRAFERFKESDDRGTKLVIVGRRKWGTREMAGEHARMHSRDDVIFTGRLPDEELARVAAASLGLVYVPFFEGFGIPILEAFRGGTAVITSNTTSMPEVAGDAALLVDPGFVWSITMAMRRLSREDDLRSELVARGLERSRDFSWERTAGLLWESIETVLRDGTGEKVHNRSTAIEIGVEP